MFCQECGFKNEDDALFCQECGVRLEKPMMETPEFQQPGQGGFNGQPGQGGFNGQPGQGGFNGQPGQGGFNGQPRQPMKPIPKLFFIVGGELLALFIMLGVCKSAVTDSSCVENTAEQYFANIVNGDYDKAFDMLELPDSEFLSKESYVKTMGNKSFGQVISYGADKADTYTDDYSDDFSEGKDEKDKSSNIQKCLVKYRIKGEGDDHNYSVTLTKDSGKKMLFFDKYCVTDSEAWKKDVCITVPKDAAVSVDGINLANYKDKEYTSETLDVYCIPYLFDGVHSIVVAAEDREEIKADFQASSGYSLNEMRYKEDSIKDLQKLAIENLEKILNAAAERKSFSEIEDLFISSDTDKINSIKETYQQLMDKYADDNFISVDFSNIKVESSTGNTNVRITADAKVKYYYEDYWSGKKIKKENDTTIDQTISFLKEDGKWVQNSIEYITFYF